MSDNDPINIKHSDAQIETAECANKEIWIEGVPDNSNNKNQSEDDLFVVDLPSATKPKVSKFQRRKKLRKLVSKVVSVVIWIAGLCLLFLCFSNLYQQIFNPTGHTGLFGIGEAVVSSNSMEPRLYPNDLIFYKSVDADHIKVGDTIIYERSDSIGSKMLIVHEVVQIGDGYVTTKGINNQVQDDPFPSSAVVGKYMFKISQAGTLFDLLSTAWAPVIIIFILLSAFALRVGSYYVHKQKIIKCISYDNDTREALNHFFDI